MNEKELNKEIQEITEENQESDNQKIDFYESREDLANIIHNIIEHPQAYKINNLENESVIISINGEWGSGKTTFLNEEIIAKIKNNKSIKYINFNAWEYDASNNALLSLFLEILKKIKVPKTKKSLEKIIKSLGKILKAIKINFGFSFFNAEIDFEKLFENSENNTLSDEIREMKKELNDLIENKEKLLIIIDELDRCKPPFAIELIEVIKHLLSNKNIIIILALNWKQLHKALENTYGLINDPKEEYLDKVVDWKFDLNDLNDKEKIIRSIAEKNDDFMKQESSDELIKWIASQYNSKEDTIRTFQNNFKKYLFHWIQRFQKTNKPNMILTIEKIVFLCLSKGITKIKKNDFKKIIERLNFKNFFIEEGEGLISGLFKHKENTFQDAEIEQQKKHFERESEYYHKDFIGYLKISETRKYEFLLNNLVNPMNIFLKNFYLNYLEKENLKFPYLNYDIELRYEEVQLNYFNNDFFQTLSKKNYNIVGDDDFSKIEELNPEEKIKSLVLFWNNSLLDELSNGINLILQNK